jgi:transcriptional regulator with PAS, ATPase and Fis domain
MENGDWKMENLPFDFQNKNAFNQSTDKVLSAFSLSAAEQLHIRKILNHTNGNKTKTAELLGIALTTLYRKLDEYKIV